MTDDNPWFQWHGDRLVLIDQTKLPTATEMVTLRTAAETIDAISRLVVRGAPAIGAAGGYGVVLGMLEDGGLGDDLAEARRRVEAIGIAVAAARPTAVNLGVAVGEVVTAALAAPTVAEMIPAARSAADEHVRRDRESCRAIGRAGADLLAGTTRFMTHCNAGRLATTGDGTALAVLYELHRRGAPLEVLASETRPLLQGGRITAWELADEGIDVRVMPDGAGATALLAGAAQAVIVGADRIARNGDTANKIGTLAHALAAREAGVPFYVAAPATTFDPDSPDGDSIPIELRSPAELSSVAGIPFADPPMAAWNPAFDVTPHRFITAFITDRGIVEPPYPSSLAATVLR